MIRPLPNYYPEDHPILSVSAIEKPDPPKRLAWDRITNLCAHSEFKDIPTFVIARSNRQVFKMATLLANAGVSYDLLSDNKPNYHWNEEVTALVNISIDPSFIEKSALRVIMNLTDPWRKFWKPGTVTWARKQTVTNKEELMNRSLLSWSELSVHLWKAMKKFNLYSSSGIKHRIDEKIPIIDMGYRSVKIGTIHNSKGREAERVVLNTQAPKKSSPHSDENHRTFFVGLSRSKKSLYLTHDPSSRHTVMV